MNKNLNTQLLQIGEHKAGETCIANSNIIQRREIDPILIKAIKITESYKNATGLGVSVLDQDGATHPEIMPKVSAFFCILCKKYNHDPNMTLEAGVYPCTKMHLDNIAEAQRRGGVYIYGCALGLIYWICPLLSGGRFTGSIIASALISDSALGLDQGRTIEKMCSISRGEIKREEAASYLAGVKVKSYSEIKALAQLYFICADQIANGGEIHNGTELNANFRLLPKNNAQIQGRFKTPAGGRGPVYSTDRERTLMAALRRGDIEEARKILNELLDALLNGTKAQGGGRRAASSPGIKEGKLKQMRLKAIELVAILSRTDITGDNEKILEANNLYLKRINEASSTEDIVRVLNVIVDRMGRQFFSFQGIRHSSALRKAERFIWENYTRKISLKEVAGASGLSASYFSTVFKEEMGENLSVYLNRLRVEKAASMLLETNKSLSLIAAECGFQDQSWFSKLFKNYTGVSPGKYWEKGGELPPGSSGVNIKGNAG